ncbi:MAG: putative thymidylate kinase [Methanomethylovorans sp. PtaU1.Bin093]|jgi:dTMP kinase|uniref:dTMP kinase n=1 Tax=Methanomethylovorans sp. PtaU1.Bin093 TaxID=1811679 RepID=UPI0009C4C87C|nr:dTMP kinase [Methanomethylovorans sp. PtaU1.Bin093]OPY22275.1 MAG: putative thymidylate kinase [Methanomethylovorans sp. PtaU1.Bin093]
MRGKLITLEGIDGSGKSTICRLLQDEKRFSGCVFTREPTTSWLGDAVNRALRSDTDHIAELMLFLADHADHISRLIRPSLESGSNVLSDRYSASRCAYQGATLAGLFDEPLDWVRSLHKGWTIDPDLILLFDIDPLVAVKRCGDRGERSKFEKMEFLNKVRSNYLRLAAEEPSRFVVVNADRPLNEVKDEVFKIIAHELEGRE